MVLLVAIVGSYGVLRERVRQVGLQGLSLSFYLHSPLYPFRLGPFVTERGRESSNTDGGALGVDI
jgi:hypothetical protein